MTLRFIVASFLVPTFLLGLAWAGSTDGGRSQVQADSFPKDHIEVLHHLDQRLQRMCVKEGESILAEVHRCLEDAKSSYGASMADCARERRQTGFLFVVETAVKGCLYGLFNIESVSQPNELCTSAAAQVHNSSRSFCIDIGISSSRFLDTAECFNAETVRTTILAVANSDGAE